MYDNNSNTCKNLITSSLRKPLIVILLVFLTFSTHHADAQNLQDLYKINDSTSASYVQYYDRGITIEPGKELLLADLKGPGKITYFYITDSSHGNFYKGLVLKVFWDDEKDPSINVPLWDFFGAISGKDINYQSVATQINHYCFMTYLPMPFSKRARFVLVNDSDRKYSRHMAYGIDYEKDPAFASVKSRLHCCWKRSNPTKRGIHEILDIKGRGQYVGNFLEVFSHLGGWWGEGDTIFTVDSERMIHTPGTEDEYGACWGFDRKFSYIYCGYIRNKDGYHRMYRWYTTNPVRFKNSLKVEIENQRWNMDPDSSRDDYISVAFWYQQDRTQPVTLQPYAERVAPSKAIKYKNKE